jgi:hypothetical protein
MAWFLIVRPPTVTLSVPTVPEAEDWSPYEIFHVDPAILLKLEEFVASKIV